MNAGITDILVITTKEYQSQFKNAIGRFMGANYTYALQDEPNGIAQAIAIGREFIGRDCVCLITGDTIIAGDGVTEHILKAIRTMRKSGNATIFVENKTYPEQYGRVIVDSNRKVEDIVGLDDSRHYYSIASFFVFPNSVLKFVDDLRPSERGRLEVLDLNKKFFKEYKLQVRMLESSCIWFDTNTFENLYRCSEYMRKEQIRK